MSKASLPQQFQALEPWVAEWSIPHEHGRFNKRVSTPLADINRFVEAVYPRMEEMVDFLNRIPGSNPDALKPDERRLFDLATMWMEASIPTDLDWDGNDIEDAWPAGRLTFLPPSIFPEPANRLDEGAQ